MSAPVAVEEDKRAIWMVFELPGRDWIEIAGRQLRDELTASKVTHTTRTP